MAKLQKRNKGVVPTIDDASDNLGKIHESTRPMSFKVPESFNKEFKQFALDNDMSLTDLFKKSFYHYKIASGA